MRPKLSSKEKDFFLVQRALCGDQEAYSAIFKKYKIILTMQISEIINNNDLASDIVMETFEKAFERLKNFQPDYQLGAWLVRIGRNCAIDYCRKRNRVNIVSIDEGFDDTEDERPTLQLLDDSRTPEESMSFKQRLEFVGTVMGELPEVSRRVLQMKFFDGFSYEEIADELDFTVQQVKTAMHKARKDLIELVALRAYEDIEKH